MSGGGGAQHGIQDGTKGGMKGGMKDGSGSIGRIERITVLGSTGSIGVSTLDVVGRHPGRFAVHALTGHRRIGVLAEQCRRHLPERAVVGAADAVDVLHAATAAAYAQAGRRLQIDHGPEALASVAAEADVVMAAIVGAAGLLPTLAAARAGRKVLLANKEALVMAGPLFMREVRAHGAMLLPIDSEHNAIFQCMPGAGGDVARDVARIVLTASGGPFREWPIERLASVTPDQAVAHPNWSMGRKISVDSATMMNKGLEVIEAHWLFGLPAAAIEVLIHPQSVIHSLVGYHDGSMLAQLGNPDMRTPIAHALAWPARIAAGVAPLDLAAVAKLSFERLDTRRFPCLPLAYAALESGGCAPAILNAANEVAVEAFLGDTAGYLDIARVVAATLEAVSAPAPVSLEDILAADAAARRHALQLLKQPKSLKSLK